MPKLPFRRRVVGSRRHPRMSGWTASVPAFLLAVILLSGCELLARDEAAEIDVRLEEALLAASEASDLSYYLLPESDDFRSIPQDPANPLTPAKVELGRLLFHDSGLAVDPRRPEQRGTWSCASCHHARA